MTINKQNGGVPMFLFDEVLPHQEKAYDVFTAGELLVDLISADYDSNSLAYHQYFGGSPSNIAMNVQKLGRRSMVASAIGEDLQGQFLLDRLRQEGMDTRCIQMVDAPTSMVLVTKSQATPIPSFYRGADYQLEYTTSIEEAIANSRILHFSCWPISNLPARQSIDRMIEQARACGLIIGFDPNYHPMIWRKGEDGVEFVKNMCKRVDVVKPSEDDAERLFGKDIPENQLAKFLALGPKLVILTMGKDGVLVSNGQETERFEALPTQVVDTTGAGDAFWSGFYAGLTAGHSCRASLKLGLAVSAYKLRYTGAIVDLPHLDQLINVMQ